MSWIQFLKGFFDPVSAGYDVRRYGGVPRRIPYMLYIVVSFLLFLLICVVLVIYTPCEDQKVLQEIRTNTDCEMMELNSVQQLMTFVWGQKQFNYPSSVLYENIRFENPGILGVFKSENMVLDCISENGICTLELKRFGTFPSMGLDCQTIALEYKDCFGDEVVFNPILNNIGRIGHITNDATGSIFAALVSFFGTDWLFDSDKTCHHMCDMWRPFFIATTEILVPVGQSMILKDFDTRLDSGSKVVVESHSEFSSDPMRLPLEWPSVGLCSVQTCSSKTSQIVYYMSLFGGVVAMIRLFIRLLNRDAADRQSSKPLPSSSAQNQNDENGTQPVLRQLSLKIKRSLDAHWAGYNLRQFQKHPSPVFHKMHIILSVLLPLGAVLILFFYSTEERRVSYKQWNEDCQMVNLATLQHQMEVGWQNFDSLPLIYVEGFPIPELNGTIWRTSHDLGIRMDLVCNSPKGLDGYCYLKYMKSQVEVELELSCPLHTSAYRKCVGDRVVFDSDTSTTLSEFIVSPRDAASIDISFQMNFNATHLYKSDKECGRALCDWISGHGYERATLYKVGEAQQLSREYRFPGDGHKLVNGFSLYASGSVMQVGWPALAECEYITESNKAELMAVYLGLVGGILTIVQILVKNCFQQEVNRGSTDSYSLMME